MKPFDQFEFLDYNYYLQSKMLDFHIFDTESINDFCDLLLEYNNKEFYGVDIQGYELTYHLDALTILEIHMLDAYPLKDFFKKILLANNNSNIYIQKIRPIKKKW